MQLDAVERAARVLIERPERRDDGADRADGDSHRPGLPLPRPAARWPKPSTGFAAAGRPTRFRRARATRRIWDMLEIRLKTRSEPPETLGPRAGRRPRALWQGCRRQRKGHPGAGRYGTDPAGRPARRPEEVTIDPRVLQALMAEYGPRVTTASGQLGVSAARGEIWTPGSAAGGGGGGIWTPGLRPRRGGAGPRRRKAQADHPRALTPKPSRAELMLLEDGR